MPSGIQSPSKRRGYAADHGESRRDQSDELSEVTSLVEKRRMQNRISQRNYRNKIRDRLEALEALVDKSKKGDALDSIIRKSTSAINIPSSGSVSLSKSVLQQVPTPPATEQHDTFELPTDHTDLWNDMPDFLDTPTEIDDEGDFNESAMNHESSLTNIEMTLRSPSSFSDNMNGSRSMSTYQMPSSALTPDPSLCMQPLETAKRDGPSIKPGPSIPDKTKSPDVSASTPSQQQPFPCNPFNYAYPFPMVGPMMPINPASFPGNMEGQSIPNHFSQQQYVWIPVPVMSLPAMPMTAQAKQGSQLAGDLTARTL